MKQPNFRALCAELVDAYVWCIQKYIHNIPEKDTLVLRARAALATPPPEPFTDDDLRGIFSRFCDSGDNGPPWIEPEEFIQATRAVLERWGK